MGCHYYWVLVSSFICARPKYLWFTFHVCDFFFREFFNYDSHVLIWTTHRLLPYSSLLSRYICCSTELDCLLDGQRWHGKPNDPGDHLHLDHHVSSWISQWQLAQSQLPKGTWLVSTGVIQFCISDLDWMYDRVSLWIERQTGRGAD